jgi:hypothetical protein
MLPSCIISRKTGEAMSRKYSTFNADDTIAVHHRAASTATGYTPRTGAHRPRLYWSPATYPHTVLSLLARREMDPLAAPAAVAAAALRHPAQGLESGVVLDLARPRAA